MNRTPAQLRDSTTQQQLAGVDEEWTTIAALPFPCKQMYPKEAKNPIPIIRSSVSQSPSSVQKRRTICWHVPTDRLGAVGLQRARASTTTGHRAATAHYSVWASTPLSLLRCFGLGGRTCTREMHCLSPRLDDIWRVVTIEFRPDFMYTFLLCRSTSFVIFNLYCV